MAHEAAPNGSDWKTVSAFQCMIGKRLGWCWIGTNYRGYRDSCTLALGEDVPDALEPRLTLLAEGSSLRCFDVTPVAA